MKKTIVITVLILSGWNILAQAKIGDNPNTANPNSVLELESADKGMIHPRVALIATTNAAPLNAHVQGMVVYNTATTGDVTPGIYANDGTKWAPLNRLANTASVTAECNGFTGTYATGTSPRTFVVTYTNNSFSTASVTPAVGDLVLSPASGLTVASVSPNTATSINSGATRVVTYTLNDSITANSGTVIRGTFTKFGLTCFKTVTTTNTAPEAYAGLGRTINISETTSVNLSGVAVDYDGTIASYAWTRSGGTGTATPVITSPSSAATTVTGIYAVGTYIFRITATDNNGATGTSTVTITANNTPLGIVSNGSGGTLTFVAHNLGANTALDPLVPAQGLNGNYYQWGRSAVAATGATSAAAISGWNTTYASNNAWNSSGSDATPVKTANDPCPTGYRVPTATEFQTLLTGSGNSVSYIGTFSNNATNYTSGMRISYASTVRLFFPSAGYRDASNGALIDRGYTGIYHSSTNGVGADGSRAMYYANSGGHTVFNGNRALGAPVKCIKI